MAKRIKNAKITFLSLCPKGKNRQPVLYKADDGSVEFAMLSKFSDNFDDDGELLSLVYVPEREDADGHFADAAEIRKMCHSFAENGMALDVRHNCIPLAKGDAYVAESYIVQKGDPRFVNWKDEQGNAVDATGSWATLTRIVNPELRRKYRSGEWGGVSLYGTGELEVVRKAVTPEDEIVNRVIAKLAKKDDIEMDKTELQGILKDNNTELSKAVAAAVKEALKPEPPKPDSKPAGGPDDGVPLFKGDPTDPVALRKHAELVEEHELRKGVNMNDAAAVREYVTKLEDLRKSRTTETKTETKTDGKSAREIELEKELDEERKRTRTASNQPTGESKPDEKTTVAGLSKEENDLLALGRRMGQASNKMRGTVKA